MTALTDLQIFEPISGALLKFWEIVTMEKSRGKYRIHTLWAVLTRQKITAANGEPAIIQLGNLTLIFASPRSGGSISGRDRALKRYANFNPMETDVHLGCRVFLSTDETVIS